jgi:RNA polymerase sigma factor (sigma-70 family)
MDAALQPSPAEAWLYWFRQHKAPQYRMTLCNRYGLNTLDAEALINEACFEVFRHWKTIDHPSAFFATTLRRQVGHYLGRRHDEQERLHAYTEAAWQNAQYQEWLTAWVTAVLATVTPRERQLLEGFFHGEDDQVVATALGIKPTTVRWLRHRVCHRLRQHSVCDGSDGAAAARRQPSRGAHHA